MTKIVYYALNMTQMIMDTCPSSHHEAHNILDLSDNGFNGNLPGLKLLITRCPIVMKLELISCPYLIAGANLITICHG